MNEFTVSPINIRRWFYFLLALHGVIASSACNPTEFENRSRSGTQLVSAIFMDLEKPLTI